jgi:hypothetical protein
VFYVMLTAPAGGFLVARAQHDVEPLLAAGRAVSAYVATLPRSPRMRQGAYSREA